MEESTEIRDTAQLDPGWGAGNEDYLENQEAIIEGIRQTMPQPLSVALDIAPVAGDAKGVVEAITGRDAVVGEELANWQRALGAVPVFGGILQKSGSLVEKLVVRFPQAWTVIKNAGSCLDELLDWLSSKLPGWKHQHATTTSEGLLIEIPDEVARS